MLDDLSERHTGESGLYTESMKPKLRLLEFVPIEEDGAEYYFVRDPQGLSPEVRLPREWGALLSRLDGTHDIEDLLAEMGAAGDKKNRAMLEKMIAELDECGLLDSPRFRREQGRIVEDFKAAPLRAAELAGGAYPADPLELRALLRGLAVKAATLGAPLPSYAPEQLRGVIVPHIDFGRGGSVEALAYERLRQANFDLLICFGIAHQGVQYPFCAAPKDFETPLGIQQSDREFIQDLQARVGDRLIEEQWAHKNEHSIEFVAVFLQGCEELKNTRFVPIICGGFFKELRDGTSPGKNADVAQFCVALRELVEERRARGERVGFIASVDLAHVGPNFDHPYPVTPPRQMAIENADRAALQFIESGDAEGFHDALATDANARNVDAHPAVYTILHAFPELRAQLLHYAQAPAPEQSIVSFASLALYEN